MSIDSITVVNGKVYFTKKPISRVELNKLFVDRSESPELVSRLQYWADTVTWGKDWRPKPIVPLNK